MRTKKWKGPGIQKSGTFFSDTVSYNPIWPQNFYTAKDDIELQIPLLLIECQLPPCFK